MQTLLHLFCARTIPKGSRMPCVLDRRHVFIFNPWRTVDMRHLIRYLATLTTGRIILWCYAVWYVVNVAYHFDARPRIWITSIGLSAIIGTALLISTRSATHGTTALDRWQIFRLYLMPFCVSSFAALVKDAGYILVFPPTLRENLVGFGLIIVFVALVFALKVVHRKAPEPAVISR